MSFINFSHQFQVPIDGILFYHKRTHYTLGSTPLVGWLKPWMLTDMLGIPLPESIMAAKPAGAKLRPPSSSDMDTEGARKKTPDAHKGQPNRTQRRSGGKKSAKGDRRSGHSMDTCEPLDPSKSPVFKFELSSDKQQNGDNLPKNESKEGMEGVS